MIFFITPASTWILLHFLCVLNTICDFWLLNRYQFHFHCNLFQNVLPFCPYHFARTILSIPFCLMYILSVYYFVHTILSVPFCPLPFCPVILITIIFCGPEVHHPLMALEIIRVPYLEPRLQVIQGFHLRTSHPWSIYLKWLSPSDV